MNEKKENRGAGIASLLMLVFAILFNSFTYFVTLTASRMLKMHLWHLNMDLPCYSEKFISALLMPGIIFGSLIVILIMKEILIRNRLVTLTLNICGAFLGVVYLSLFAVAVYLPFIVTRAV